jgi:hypothetical protein
MRGGMSSRKRSELGVSGDNLMIGSESQYESKRPGDGG